MVFQDPELLLCARCNIHLQRPPFNELSSRARALNLHNESPKKNTGHFGLYRGFYYPVI